ncbi:DUF6961 family protein [Sphingopyxis indica]|uniref:Uncharacterized protein n=1 Tax=Sphingopyxis indica TaxID=436663 RepID=A0A239JVX0_9SPHN|nr:hypothetical protein [Sphingopyxis indica]SNT09608.1 hypothetical protein SAMN06295955_11188 [Sphingopyxis indica]
MAAEDTLTAERHVWACALAVQNQYGPCAALHVAERIGALALQSDSEGIAMWKAIAARLDALARGSDEPLS